MMNVYDALDGDRERESSEAVIISNEPESIDKGKSDMSTNILEIDI